MHPLIFAFVGLPLSFIVITVLIIRYKLKKTELEMLGRDSVDVLRDDLDDTRAQLADMQEHTRGQLAQMLERLDFAERLLTAGRASQEGEEGK